MSDYRNPVDIGNRALQHCGASRITALSDDSKNASEIDFAYNKLRLAELRRNVWRFAIRRACIRPIDTDSTLLSPEGWDDATVYEPGAVVSHENQLWEATATTAEGEEPGGDEMPWEIYAGPMTIQPYDADTVYFSGDLVIETDVVYRSLTSGNDDALPGATWLSLGDASATLSIRYPVGAGPASQSASRNVYRLPNGFLRKAVQEPHQGSYSYLGGATGAAYTDWDMEGNYIVTAENQPIVLRFVADITKVTSFDSMFSEGLAARIALEVVETLTQSGAKLAAIGANYQRFMSEARTINGIETGTEEPAEDDYVSCRV